ncbi:MAG: hypothetical protein IJ746_00090 [Ruminococcus sp.]|nr:hypothetical protein [Ruminococcus sp.]
MSERSMGYLSEALDCLDHDTVEEALDLPPRRGRVLWIAAAAAVCAFAVGAAVWFTAVGRGPSTAPPSALDVSEISDSSAIIAGGYEGGAASTDPDTAHLDRLVEVSEVIVIGSPATVSEGGRGGADIFSEEHSKEWSAVAVERVLKGTAVPDTLLLARDENDNSLHLEAEPFVPLPEAGRYIWFLGAGTGNERELIEYIPEVSADGSESPAYAYVISKLGE